ncbi:MAG TPA: SgcJ/EcaC family oxidoreductase [Candidatus Eisenbacteria bacterium]
MIRALAVPLALGLLLVVGPAARPAAAKFEPDSTGMLDVPLTFDQERAVADTLAANLTAAWNAADLDAWTACYWPDASSVTLRGGLMSDRKEIAERQAARWSGIFKGSRIRITVRRVRGLGNAALLVEADVAIRGYQSLPAGIRARADGALAARASYVLLNRFGRWRILHHQCTAEAEAPRGRN